MRSGRPTGVERSRATEHSADGVTKFYDSFDKASAAASKYRALTAINADRFRSPVVRGVHDDPARIDFAILEAERTADTAMLAALRDDDLPLARDIAGRVGGALAHIHEHLDLPAGETRSRAPALRAELAPNALSAFGPTPLVALHGDFGFSNVWLGTGGVPVVFDAEPSRYTTNAIDAIDYPEMDLATYITCLAGRASRLRDARLLRANAGELIAAFLDAYRRGRGEVDAAFDRDRLAYLITAQAAAYRSFAPRRSAWGTTMAARRAAAISSS